MAVQLRLSKRAARKLSLVLVALGFIVLLAIPILNPEKPELGRYSLAIFIVLMVSAWLLLKLSEEETSFLDELREMPVPLGWLNVNADEARLLREHLVPALRAAENIAKGRDNARIYAKIIFEQLNELLKEIPKKYEQAASHRYPDKQGQKKARSAWITRMQQIVKWIEATRNLTAHGRYMPSAVEAYTALQAVLDLLDALKPANKATLFARCPDDRVVTVSLQKEKVSWYSEIEICRYRRDDEQEKIYRHPLDHKLLEQHYKILEEQSKLERKGTRKD